MLGAIAGDIIGSRFEFANYRGADFELFNDQSRFTDDSVMTLAVGQALLESVARGFWPGEAKGREEALRSISQLAREKMVYWGRQYPHCGYGGRFQKWLQEEEPQAYHSFGNGAAMRVSAAGWLGRNLRESIDLAQAVTRVSHDHPLGLQGAEATAVAIYLARAGASKEELRWALQAAFYPLNFTIADLRPHYTFNESCQGTVPQAMVAFLEADSWEESVRLAVSLGGDSDTLAAIAGSIAEAFYGVPPAIGERALTYLPQPLRKVYLEWRQFWRERAPEFSPQPRWRQELGELYAVDLQTAPPPKPLEADPNSTSALNPSPESASSASEEIDRALELVVNERREELKARNAQLREVLTELLAQRDDLLQHQAVHLKNSYTLALGGLEYKILEVNTRVRRLERQIELARQALNRRQKPDWQEIEERLEGELAQYQELLKEKIKELEKALDFTKRAVPLSDEEALELKKLYRQLVRRLHPDLNPNLSPAQQALFRRILEAYSQGDLLSLRLLSQLSDEGLEDQAHSSSLDELEREHERLEEERQELAQQIAKILGRFPFTVAQLLEDPAQLQKRRQELQEQLDSLHQRESYLQGVLQKLRQEAEDVGTH